MIKQFLFIGIAVWTITLFAPTAEADENLKMPTTEKIMALNTDHFKILYQKPLANAVPAVAAYCEEAYFVLTRMLDFNASEIIRVYLVDTFDTHNGWAMVIPHNTMAIYLTGTEQGSQIYQPGSYLRRTVYHELMHVLSMDMRAGYNHLLEKIFGKIDPRATGGDLVSYLMFLATSSPNMLAPNWYMEGLAMYAETEFAGPGRGQSTLGDMLFRTAVRDDNLIPYSQWYLETPRWPYGSAAYWYGMRMIQYLSETSTRPNPVGDTARAVSQSFLFNLKGGIEKVTQKHWKILADEMLQHERKHQTANLQTLASVTYTPTQRLTPKTIAVFNARYVGDTIFLMARSEDARNNLYMFRPDTGTLTNVDNTETPVPIGSFSATADGRYLYYTHMENVDTENLWYELRRYDTATGENVTVTRRGRYRSVDISPDGVHLAAVSQRQGHTDLMVLPVASAGDPQHENVIATVGLGADLAAPRFSPDGRQIVYVEADATGFQLKLYHRDRHQSRRLWRASHRIMAPSWHPDGKSLIFGSDANGVYNLYRLALGKGSAPMALTHVWGGLFLPSLSPDGRTLAAIQVDGFGPHLITTDYAPNAFKGHNLPAISPRWQGGKLMGLKAELYAKRPEWQATFDKVAGQNYNSLSAIRPNFWTPWATASTFGAQGGLAASFSDSAQHHELIVMAGTESEYQSPLARINYTYRGLKPDIRLYGSLNQSGYPDLLTESATQTRYDYAEETQVMGTALSVPLWTRLSRQLTFNVGYEYLQRDAIDDIEDDYAGISLSIQPTQENQGSVWGRLDYFSGTIHERSTSIEDGALISIGAEYSNPSLGGDIDATRLLVDINQYISMPYARNHVLKLSGSYAAGWGDDFAQGLISIGGSNLLPAAASPGITRVLGLRGYDTNFQTGQRAVRAAAAYRFPVLNIFKGVESGFPLYNRDLFLEVFYEGGRTYDDNDIGDAIGWLNAAGVEVNYGLTLLRFLQIAPGIGVVYAPQRDEHDPDKDEVVGYLSIKFWTSF